MKLLEKNELVNKIVNVITNSENGLIEAQKSNFLNYVSVFSDYAKLTRIQQKNVLITICDKNAHLSKRSIQNKLALLTTATKNEIDIAKYSSFTSIENANKLVRKGTAKITRTGENKGKVRLDKKADSELQISDSIKIKAKNDAIELIKSDAKFKEFMIYANENFDLNFLRLAIK